MYTGPYKWRIAPVVASKWWLIIGPPRPRRVWIDPKIAMRCVQEEKFRGNYSIGGGVPVVEIREGFLPWGCDRPDRKQTAMRTRALQICRAVDLSSIQWTERQQVGRAR